MWQSLPSKASRVLSHHSKSCEAWTVRLLVVWVEASHFMILVKTLGVMFRPKGIARNMMAFSFPFECQALLAVWVHWYMEVGVLYVRFDKPVVLLERERECRAVFSDSILKCFVLMKLSSGFKFRMS